MTQAFNPQLSECGDFATLEPYYRTLLDRPIESLADLRRWLDDLSLLQAAVSEYGSRRNIDYTCHTDDPAIEKAYMDFVENVRPKIQPLSFALSKKYLACGYADKLEADRFAVMTREWAAEVEVYRDANVPLQTEVTRTYTQYDKLCGQMQVEFRGQQYTLQQLARFIEEPDRATRKEAWELSTKRRMQDREAMDTIFDKLLQLRGQIAKNADFSDYRAYKWKSSCRFDYTPEDCHAFAKAIEETCVPVAAQMHRQRREDLRVEALRPWDLAVDPQGRGPLRPFDPKQVDEMVSKVGEVFARISPLLARQYAELKPGKNLDLESRKGKRPGGYQSSLEVAKEPFIFMNSAGLHRDVETMLHEGGHAFHYMAARDEPLVFLRHAPLEFCEVASMSMELLAMEYMSVFYNEADAARAMRAQLEGIIKLLPWVATIDQFQHWLYTHPGHSQAERTAAWLKIYDRFSDREVDWSGYADAREARWQAQIHLFHYPFYYIEYGIAQLGALQVWMNYRSDPKKTLEDLFAAFALGGKAPLPDLFETAGIRFEFSSKTIGPLMKRIGEELATLPV